MSILDLDCDMDVIDTSVIKFVKIYYGNYHRIDDEYLQLYPYMISKNDNINVSINDYDPWTILYVHFDNDRVLISDQEIIDDKIGYKLSKCLYHDLWKKMGGDGDEIRLKDVFLYINMYKKGKLSINFNWELQTWID